MYRQLEHLTNSSKHSHLLVIQCIYDEKDSGGDLWIKGKNGSCLLISTIRLSFEADFSAFMEVLKGC